MGRTNHGARILGALLLAGVLILLIPQCLLIPERGFVGEASGNSRPSCQITGGILVDTDDPALAESGKARIHFYWFGSDEDGLIRWFEWAIDDTISADAWHQTTAFDEVIPFEAAAPANGTTFSGWHTFFIRAVDNEYSRSRPARRYFDAQTIAPDAEIIRPEKHTEQNLKWARTLKITWKGEDTDGARADKLPSYFEYKWVQFSSTWTPNPTNLTEIRNQFAALPNEFLRDSLRRGDFPSDEYYDTAMKGWIRVPGTTDEAWLENMVAGRKYGFVVRAIDEAGAVEPALDWDNWTIFSAQDKNIIVTVSESALGYHQFQTGNYETWDVSVAPEQLFRFEWSGDASAAGTDPGPSNYGFDIPNPEDEIDRALDGMGGWIGWGQRTKMDRAISFPRADEGVTHHFYLKMRDVSGVEGTETRGHVAIRVARLSFHRKFLLVDDINQSECPRSCVPFNPLFSPPSDNTLDTWDANMFAGMGEFLSANDKPGRFAFWGANDVGQEIRQVDAILDTLGQYQTLIWDAGRVDRSSGLNETALSGVLARYVGAGGNLVLMCYEGPVTTVTNTFPVNSESPAAPSRSLGVNPAWDRFSFLWLFLGLRPPSLTEAGGEVDKPRWPNGSPEGYINTFEGMTLSGARAENQIYPDLQMDWARFGCDTIGVYEYEALWPEADDPDLVPWFERDPGMQILYRSKTYTQGVDLDSLPIAWRTFSTSASEARGRIVCFAFHPYYFEQESIRGAMTLALRWAVTGSDF